MNNKQLIIILFLVIVAIGGSKAIGFPVAKEKKISVATVASMEACLNSEKAKGHGQDHLDSTYRLCWMRAKTDASK